MIPGESEQLIYYYGGCSGASRHSPLVLSYEAILKHGDEVLRYDLTNVACSSADTQTMPMTRSESWGASIEDTLGYDQLITQFRSFQEDCRFLDVPG
jgi:hypothetical protein